MMINLVQFFILFILSVFGAVSKKIEFREKDVIVLSNGHRYAITAYLGRGVHGIVYEAQDLQTRDIKALKFLRDKTHKKLKSEALNLKEAGQLVEYGYDQNGNRVLVMKRVPGKPLIDAINDNDIPAVRYPEIKRKLLESLKKLHREKNIVHNDPHMGNVMYENSEGHERFEWIDFGESELVKHIPQRNVERNLRNDEERLADWFDTDTTAWEDSDGSSE